MTTTTSHFERVAELHSALCAYATTTGRSCYQTISDHGAYCRAMNAPAHSLEFVSRIAPDHLDLGSDQYSALRQGFGAIDVNLIIVWGGQHHDGTPRAEPEIWYTVTDRRAGVTCPMWSHDACDGLDNPLEFEGILPLIQSLLG